MKKFYYYGLFLACAMVSMLMACGSDDEEVEDIIDSTPIILAAGNEKAIDGAESVSVSNEFVATVSGNVVKAWHVGETTLLVNGQKNISLKVYPVYNLYNDPVCNWGCDMNYVRSNQKQGTLSSKSDNTHLYYENAGAASILGYTFEGGKLESVIAVVSTNHASAYGSFLAERYLMIPTYIGEDTYFAGIDGISVEVANTFVLTQVYSVDYIATLYASAKKYPTRSVMSEQDLKSLVEEILQ